MKSSKSKEVEEISCNKVQHTSKAAFLKSPPTNQHYPKIRSTLELDYDIFYMSLGLSFK